MQRLLISAQIDLNLIDGSAIWLASVAELLAALPELHVSVLLMKRIRRDVMVQALLVHPRVTLLDLWQMAEDDAQAAELLRSNPGQALAPATAAAAIDLLSWRRQFDLCLVRGAETAAHVAQRPHLSGRLWVYVTDLPGGLHGLFVRCRRMLCQTEEARVVLAQRLGTDPRRLTLLPPMIPAIGSQGPPVLSPAAPVLGYAGKLSPPYRILEMLEAFEAIRRQCPGAEFHIVGDKIHNVPPRPGFEAEVLQRLRSTPGVVWHGGVSRDETQAILSRINIASSWRDESFNDSLELSTKVLEYAALGVPILLNPSPLQRRLFGSDYPGYVTTVDEFAERFLALAASPERYHRLSEQVRQVAQRYTFAAVGARLQPLIAADRAAAEPRPERRLLFSGHDFRFARFLIEHFERQPGYAAAVDLQHGHTLNKPAVSQRWLQSADLIFCEWCLGNAVWYSQHKLPHQKLVVRLHRQELTTPYLEQVEWPNVDGLVFIAPGVMQAFLQRFPALADRAVLIFNAVDCARFDAGKLEGAEFNLGVLGALPRLKAPHRALEILEGLKRRDQRYTLVVKSKRPEELAWLWKNPEEARYYSNFFEGLQRSSFANSVVWEPYTDDVVDWFMRVGFVLSTSDLEGSHQAVAEGMASGAVPVIYNWAGAGQLYPAKYVCRSVEEAVEMIVHWRTPKHYARERDFCRDYARRHFDRARIIGRYHRLFEQLLAGAPAGQAVPAPVSQPLHA